MSKFAERRIVDLSVFENCKSYGSKRDLVRGIEAVADKIKLTIGFTVVLYQLQNRRWTAMFFGTVPKNEAKLICDKGFVIMPVGGDIGGSKNSENRAAEAQPVSDTLARQSSEASS